MTSSNILFWICVVVHDVQKANANWAKVLSLPEVATEVIFPGGILHCAHGQPTDYVDCQVATYLLDGFVLELMQSGPGVFHVCVKVGDRKVFQQTLADIGVEWR